LAFVGLIKVVPTDLLIKKSVVLKPSALPELLQYTVKLFHSALVEIVKLVPATTVVELLAPLSPLYQQYVPVTSIV